MNFDELRAKDKVKAFLDYIAVEEAKERGIIPEDFAEYFPNECLCGSTMIITRNRKSLMCCDPRCYIKVSKSLHEFYNRFEIKNFGERTAEKIVRQAFSFMEKPSHIRLLGMEEKYLFPDARGMDYVTFMKGLFNISETSLTFAQMVGKLAIPEYDGLALKAFGDVGGTAQLIEEINKVGSVQSYLAKRGIYDPKATFYLLEFLPDIAFAETRLFKNLRQPGKFTINIVMTGTLKLGSTKITKQNFVYECNKIGRLENGMQLFDVEASVAKATAQFIIASGPSTFDKYLTGLERQRVEKRKILFTPDEFIEYLKEVVLCVKEGKSLPSLSLSS